MEKTKVTKIILKGMGRDENGLQQYIWATKKQASDIMNAQYDDSKRDRLFYIGGESFRVTDVVRMSEVSLEEARNFPAFRPYVLEALEAERHEAAKLVNPEGKARLDALKNKYRIGQGGTC